MSKYKNWWRPNVVRAIQIYPYLKAAKMEAQAQAVTADYSGSPRGSTASRSTERAATRQFSEQEELLIEAVDKAIAEVSHHQDGAEVMKIVKLVDFEQRFTVERAAMELHMSRNTAGSRRARFIDLVGKYMNF